MVTALGMVDMGPQFSANPAIPLKSSLTTFLIFKSVIFDPLFIFGIFEKFSNFK